LQPIKKLETLFQLLRQDQCQDFSVFSVLIPASGSSFFPPSPLKTIILILRINGILKMVLPEL
jgi:hypothetical protein